MQKCGVCRPVFFPQLKSNLEAGKEQCLFLESEVVHNTAGSRIILIYSDCSWLAPVGIGNRAQHLCVYKVCLWLKMLDNLFWTAAGPNSDASCFRELVCKWHCSPHNLHLVSFSLKIIAACVRFQGLILCLFSEGDQQVVFFVWFFFKRLIHVIVYKQKILARHCNTQNLTLSKLFIYHIFQYTYYCS